MHLPPSSVVYSNNWQFSTQYTQMCSELKTRMRSNKRKVLPNSKELVVNYNSRVEPDVIHEHNDPLRIEWTEIPANPQEAPGYITGKAALRIPDNSNPRYKLFWPIQYGWLNEAGYPNRIALFEDISTIIEDAIKHQLNLKKKREWGHYSCVFVIPDLYEREYVTQVLEMLIRDIGFGQVSFIQESLAATFGATYTSACVVDIGAQKTSVCCVEEGMCIENSRVNIKIGGADVTDTFIRMMLYDHFPYSDINLKRRYDFVLAHEIKEKFCTMNETDISVQLYDFHLRAPGENTAKYQFKTYDEVLLAPQGLFQPHIFDHSKKLRGRRKLIGPSRDLYDDSPNDPTSAAQSEIIQTIAPHTRPEASSNGQSNGTVNGNHASSTPMRQLNHSLNRVADSEMPTSQMGSPAPEGEGTPAPGADGTTSAPTSLAPCLRDDVLPVIGLDTAILTSILHGARGDERKARDFLGGIMVIGGGAQVPGFLNFLEDRIKQKRPGHAKDVMIAPAPRELDSQVVVWKGGSVYAKLRSTQDLWIGRLEFDRLGSRALAYKCLWAW